MSRRFVVLFSVVASLVLTANGFLGDAWSRTRPESVEEILAPPHLSGEVLVKFRPEATSITIDSYRLQLGATASHTFRSGAERWTLGPGHTVAEAIDLLARSPDVHYVEPNYLLSVTATPNDPRYAELYGLHNTGQTGGTPGADIDAERAWDLSTGSSDVVVAVIDTGVDYNHPDLAANAWIHPAEVPGNGVDDDGNGYVDDVRGWDFYNDDNDPMDDHSHGTHTAGTIGAVGNNAVGVVGVAWTVKILPLKFLGAGGSGSTADAVLAVEYATAAGVDVMSNSWGGGGFSQALLDAIQAASDAGILFVAAAGNESSNNDLFPFYPSSYEAPNVVSVAATDHNDLLAYFSSYGATSVDLAAPGVSTLSCLPGASYGYKSGTSMATPHVSGVAALIKSVAPDIDLLNLKQRILDSVDPVPSLAGLVLTGGRLNAFLSIADPDTIPPGAVADLAVAEAASNSLGVTWTAPGDDEGVGRATAYEVRWSEQPIDEGNFELAQLAPGAPRPKEGGQAESMEIAGLQPSRTYFIALKTRDEWGNRSALSNVASGATLPPPTFASSPASFDVALLTGGSETRVLTLGNAGEGTLDWTIPDPVPPGSSDWLTTQPRAGRLHAGEQAEVGIEIDATGLDGGVYQSSVDVNTNDPDRPVVGHPVTLTVTGAPDILVAGEEIRLASSQSYFTDGAVTSHALTILVPPAGGGNLDLVADGDYGFAGETATASAEGRPLGTVGVVGEDCVPADGTFPISASDLSALSADGVVHVEVRNGIEVNVFCATNAHRVTLRYRGPGDSFDFGSLFVGASRSIPIEVHNRGSATLAVTAVSTDPAEFVASETSFAVPPREFRTLTVAFTPSSAQAFEGTLQIESDDPDTPVSTVTLTGVGLEPPVISVAPSSMASTLDEGSEETQTLTISNTGGSALEYSIVVEVYPGAVVSSEFGGLAGGVAGPGNPLESDPVETDEEAAATVAPDGTFTGVPGEFQTLRSSPVPLTCVVGDETARILYAQANQGTAFYRYVADSDAWESLASSPIHSGNNGGAALLLGKIYTTYAESSSMGVYDIATGTWSTRSSPLPYTGNIASDGTDYLYLAAGSRLVRFDPVTGTSTDLAPPPFVFEPWGGLEWHDGVLYGHQGNSYRSFGAYDTSTGTWRSLPTVPAGAVLGSAIDPFAGDYYAMGSYQGRNLYRYSIATGAWSVVTIPTFAVNDGGLAWMPGPEAGILIVQGERGSGLARYVTETGGVTVNPRQGTVAPGGTAEVAVRFDARTTPPGTHESTLSIRSNDPVTPEVGVPVSFTVIGRPDIALVGERISSESTVPYTSYSATTRHTFPLSETPSGSATVALTADGDFGDFSETATATAEGVPVGQVGATGSDCTPASGTFGIDSETFATLAADGVVFVDVTNTSNVDLFCTRNQHTVRLTWSRPADRLDYGELFVGASRSIPIEVHNRGSVTLSVTSVASDRTEFVPSETSFAVPPRGFRTVTVAFTPSSAQTFEGTLRIDSDDPDTPVSTVSLSGVGLIPPDIEVAPDGFSVIANPGQTLTRTLEIANIGGSDLDWELAIHGGFSSDISVPGPAETPLAATSDAVPEGFDPRVSEPSTTAGARALLVQDFQPWRSDANERLLVAHGIPYDRVISGALASVDLRLYQTVIVASDQPSGTYQTIATHMARLEQFVYEGGILQFHAAGWGWNGGNASLVTLPGGMRIVKYYSGINHVLAPDHPVMTGIPEPFAGSYASHASFSLVPAGAVLIGADERGIPNLVEYRFGSGRVLASGHTLEFSYDRAGPVGRILENLIAYTGRPRVRWLSAAPTEGTVPAASTTPVTLTFDAGTLEPGDYEASVVVDSNDPDEATTIVPVTLHVVGVPDIVVTPQTLEFGTVFVGFPRTLTVRVENVGLEPLNVLSIAAGDPEVFPDAASFTVAPGDFRDVLVSVDPQGPRSIATTVAVVSDDPDEGQVDVTVTALALIPPDVDLAPLSIEATELAGDSASRTVTIGNSGGSDLVWRLERSAAPLGPDPSVAAVGVLLVQDVAPWNTTSNEQVLAANGIPWTVISSTAVASTDLSRYPMVLLAGDQRTSYYTTLGGRADQLAAYVAGGGVLEVHAAGFGSNSGDATRLPLPGGTAIFESLHNVNFLSDPSHPIVAGVPDPIFAVFLSTAAFWNVPEDAARIVRNQWDEDNLIVYRYGAGIVIAIGQNLELGYRTGASHGRILQNTIPWAYQNARRWLSVSPSTGVVPAGGIETLAVTLDADGLAPGEHRDSILVASNDPDEPTVAVSVKFNVLRLRSNAGPDQVAECSGGGGSVVTLDGSASSHMDGPGNLTEYLWSESGTTLGEGETTDLHLPLGEHTITLRVSDATGAFHEDDLLVTVVDTTPPAGDITYPTDGACLGADAVPVVVADDFTDACDGTVDRRYEPADGEIWTAHGRHEVTLFATDGRGHTARSRTVSFDLDTVPPVATSLVEPELIELATLMPVSRFFDAHDADGVAGDVVLEVVTVDGCTLYDGFVYGNRDGRLLDESVPDERGTLCRLAEACGRRRWTDPRLEFRAEDCGGNTGIAPVTVPGQYTAAGCRFELTISLSTAPDGTRVSWDSVLGATGYDVVRGRLETLRQSDGRYRFATVECVASLEPSTSVVDPTPPPAADGFWYLVRDVTDGLKGSWDEPAPSQVGSREGIDSAAGRCP